ncbi:MAG: 1-deoxy-D-xylulose-5-phosphate reductoisomerase [Pirellulaceae bacterium]|nr:1-deoxy-D-xylulose-5-phosphate reductoisomerase [Pirellulaceae bacterium]MDP7016170.1 1-deoxy-D-xylulose-5-phosphate reductoisomerase [Pirellulaceae bacterium]
MTRPQPNPDGARNVAILGSTGSIGGNALDVIAESAGQLNAIGISAHTRTTELAQQVETHRPRWVVVTAEEANREPLDGVAKTCGCEVWSGSAGIEKMVGQPEVDVVVAAIVGSAGLRGAWAALDAGKTLALANKETLVMAGSLVTELAARRDATILPVDSEHSAIFQALQNGRRDEVSRIILTASGGPFRTWTAEQLKQATVDDALAHPTWDMGPKVTVDSATMMNKALEIIEARWLFDMPADKIDVVVHPQSLVHSLVEYIDGSVIAQLSPPDMRLPIQYALTYPERRPGPARKLDLTAALQIDFEPPDEDRFPALALGHEVAAAGGTAGAVLNAANEAAVATFLEGQLRFSEIVPACRSVLHEHNFSPNPTLEELTQLDRWAREEVMRVCS